MPETKFYWKIAKLIHLCIIYDCLTATQAELRSGHKPSNIYYLALFRNSLLMPDQRHWYSVNLRNRNVFLFTCVRMHKQQIVISETKQGYRKLRPVCTCVCMWKGKNHNYEGN